MKPTVISNANAAAASNTGGPQGTGVTIPINHEYSGHPQAPYHTHAQHYVAGEPLPTTYGSPGSHGRAAPQQQQPHPHPQQIPAHFQQDFDFEPDMGMDMFPRSRLGRMTHDPFGDFGGTTHFGFPQFNSLGRRRVNPHNDDDFFNRLPSEFRQYIPESFAQRRAGAAAGMPGSPGAVHTQQQQPPPQQTPSHFYNTMPQSPSKKVCDAAIQTEDPTGRSEVDHHGVTSENLNQHGLRNTMDMGVKSAAENEMQGIRSSSAPPTEQQQQQQQYMQQTQQPYYTQQQQQSIPINGKRPTPPPQQQNQQFGTQTSPQVQTPGGYSGQAPPFQKVYYPPQQQAHPQQKQHTPPPPQTPGGTYIRSIPIFVEGRSEPIINNKEIPNQNAPPSAAASANTSARGFTPPKQQSHRPTPLNTQQQPSAQQQSGGLPPQTPHTVDTINKIQDIQRDVLALMSRVEQFTGTRADKEYVYLDEMLTRNLLKLDNIDTNGKESIRLARREAIKCIEASINVLEAKAEENKKAAQAAANGEAEIAAAADGTASPQKSGSGEKVAKETIQTTEVTQPEEPIDANKIQEPIPLPPPESQKFNMVQIEDCPEDESTPLQETQKESSPKPESKNDETAAETK